MAATANQVMGTQGEGGGFPEVDAKPGDIGCYS